MLARSAAATRAATLLCLLGTAAPSRAQSPAGPSTPAAPAIPLHGETLGSYSWPISTAEAVAQGYFDQGARLMFAYAIQPARLSFGEARRADPACAMCWWGEAWSLGPFFNGGMREADLPRAREAVERAAQLAADGPAVERALIEALAVRYGQIEAVVGRTRVTQDSAYANAMAEVHAQFPDHPEVATLYADALMLLEPRRGVWPIEKASVRSIHAVLEGVLARDPGHPGACHAYVHATETTPKVVEAQRCADRLGSSIPGVSHINHMPSHTYNRVGRWGDATRANIEAWETDRRASRGDAFAIYPSHNLHMLFFSAAMDGQGELALTAAREYGQYNPTESVGFQALILARFGRFEEIFELPDPLPDLLPRGFRAFGRGMAHLRAGRADSASHYLARVDSLASPAHGAHWFRFHSAADLLGIVGGILRGEVLAAEGRIDEAVAAFETAAEIEAGLRYDEPEPLPFLVRDYLGALLLDAGRAAEAEHAYAEALAARPNNGWSLIGLERALRAQGRTAEAERVQARFEAAWARADVRLNGSRF